jgi:hypothetical protein
VRRESARSQRDNEIERLRGEGPTDRYSLEHFFSRERLQRLYRFNLDGLN